MPRTPGAGRAPAGLAAGLAAGVAAALVVTGCAAGSTGLRTTAGGPAASSTAAVPGTASPTASPTPSPTATPPPAFAARIAPVTASQLPSTYRPGCPVPPSQLRLLTMSYWGFDGAAHTGVMVVNGRVATDVVAVFRTLYDARFPIRQMRLVDDFGGSDDASVAADNTAGFNCRYAVAPGPPSWSAHAYGEAIDVDPLENPYVEGGRVIPPAGAPYVDRSKHLPGMIHAGDVVWSAFASIGWKWGGRWASTPDWQHFSLSGS